MMRGPGRAQAGVMDVYEHGEILVAEKDREPQRVPVEAEGDGREAGAAAARALAEQHPRALVTAAFREAEGSDTVWMHVRAPGGVAVEFEGSDEAISEKLGGVAGLIQQTGLPRDVIAGQLREGWPEPGFTVREVD